MLLRTWMVPLCALAAGIAGAAALVAAGVVTPAPSAASPPATVAPTATPFPPLRADALPALAANPPLAAAYELRLVQPDASGESITIRSASLPHVAWAPRGETLAWTDETGLRVLRPGGEPRRLGDRPQKLWWSPTGTHLAAHDGQTLRVLTVTGATAMSAAVEGELRSLAWSPSGASLAWTVHRTLTPYQDFRTAGANEWTVVVRPVTAAGRSANQWTYPTPGTATPGEVLAWAPDDTSLLLRTGERLQRLTLASSLLTDIGTGEEAAVSPQGDTVAFTQRLPFPPCPDGASVRQAITVLTWTTGDRSTVLPQHCGLGGGPMWSPDGRLLAHIATTGALPEVVLADPATGLVRSIGGATGATTLAWTPDGGGIVIRQEQPGTAGHRLLPAAGGAVRPLAGDGFGGFSSDGRRYLAASADTVNVGSPSGPERAIATLADGARWVDGAWSADGRWIAFVTRPKAQSHFVLNLASGALTERSEAGCEATGDALSVMSPDGNRRARVAWDAERQALRIVVVDNLRTGRTGLLVDGDANFQSLVWALDSLHVGYARRPGKNGEPASYGVGTLPAGDTREVATFTTEGTLIASAVAPGGHIVAFAFGDQTGILLSVEGKPGLVPIARSAAQITCLAFTADSELLFTSVVGE